MEIQETVFDTVSVISLSGNLWEESDTTLLAESVTRLKGNGRLRLILDMSNVPLLNSSGLGALIASMKTMREAGGKLVLVNANARIENLLQITKLNTVLESYSSFDEAANQLKSG